MSPVKSKVRFSSSIWRPSVFSLPGNARAFIQYQEREQPSVFLSLSPLPEPFVPDVRAPTHIEIDGDLIGDRLGIAILFKLHRNSIGPRVPCALIRS